MNMCGCSGTTSERAGREAPRSAVCVQETGAPAWAEQAACAKAPASVVFRARADVYETPDAFVIEADMPGVAEHAIDITVTDRVLTIVGRVDANRRGGAFLTREYGVGDFQRSFQLGEEADPEAIAATLADGVVRVTIGKATRARTRRIAVTPARAGNAPAAHGPTAAP